eukprot:TRINITY_DN2971_c0_g1_i2.p1 TRINITY_DN2971_c0_g1~~TRINITY_DN2971_c0_g1_i2.p1  ORF type:complete len:496 (+),score=72.33 TRINITY_DN2971_c0_g1_i2:25-1488(+)
MAFRNSRAMCPLVLALALASATVHRVLGELELGLASGVFEEEVRVRELREALETASDDAAETDLTRALAALHALPVYRKIGPLSPSMHEYGTSRLLGDQAAVTSYQKGMLLLNRNVQILDPPSMQLPVGVVKKGWAAYNPAVLPIEWRGQRSFLLTYRVSTWNLCKWDARSSPLDRLPVIKDKKTVTSKIAAVILNSNFEVVLPVQDIDGIAHKDHICNHHTGMRRAGVDDGRLFMLSGQPWLLFAAVALKGERSYCFHHMMLCQLELPDSETGQVRCLRKIPLKFGRADEISEAAKSEGRLQNVHQKNWSPFVSGDKLYLVFTVEPFTVVHVDPATGHCTQVSETPTPAMKVFHRAASPGQHSTFGVHGGSPYIQLPAPNEREHLGIGRVARGNTQYVLFFHTLVPIGKPSSDSAPRQFAISRVSPLFCFASTSPAHAGLCETIQFAGGLFIEDDHLIVTYGTNDCEAKVAFMPLQRVLALLAPAS